MTATTSGVMLAKTTLDPTSKMELHASNASAGSASTHSAAASTSTAAQISRSTDVQDAERSTGVQDADHASKLIEK